MASVDCLSPHHRPTATTHICHHRRRHRYRRPYQRRRYQHCLPFQQRQPQRINLASHRPLAIMRRRRHTQHPQIVQLVR